MNKILKDINNILSEKPTSKKGGNVLIVNGKKFDVKGSNISISNSVIKVNGKVITNLDGGHSEVLVKFEGDLASLACHNADVNGNIKGDVQSHNLDCGDVGGSVTAHNVDCGDVQGNITAKNVSN